MKPLRITYFILLACLLTSALSAQEPSQVNVSVKIIEFQTSKGLDTGFSAYFKKRLQPQPYGQVETGKGIFNVASLAFPSQATSGITVFVDQINTYYGDIDLILQGLVDQNRAFILSQPKVMVPVGSAVPTIIKTTQDVPYENTVVVGATAIQTTAFQATGVTLTVSALEVAKDDDGDPNTEDPTFVKLNITAEINEEGQRITVALDDSIAGAGGLFTRTTNAISVPEFVARSITTTVWVRNNQVLVLGGLYRNTKNKNTATLPWLTQGDNMLNNVIGRVSPVNETPNIPLAPTFGSLSDKDSRRELVFLVKADLWRKAFTVSDAMEFGEEESLEGEGDAEIIAPKQSPRFIEGIIDTFTDDDFSMGVGGRLGAQE